MTTDTKDPKPIGSCMEDIRREWIARGIISADVQPSAPPEVDPKRKASASSA